MLCAMNRFVDLATYVIFLLCAFFLMHVTTAYINPESEAVQEQQTSEMTGDYNGYIFLGEEHEKIEVGLTVNERKDNEYEAVLYFGGLPDLPKEASTTQKTIELQGRYIDYTLRLRGNFPFTFQFIHHRYTALDDKNNYMGHLEKVIRVNANQ